MRGATRVFESLVAFLTEKNYNEEVRGYSTSVVPWLPKLVRRVRLPLSAFFVLIDARRRDREKECRGLYSRHSSHLPLFPV